MIVTFTNNANGQRRIYLGGKSSLECWLEPKADNVGWTFHLAEAVTGNKLAEADKRTWAVHTLRNLATALNVELAELPKVPIDTIAALHTADPYLARRVASPKSRVIENGFTAVSPRAEFSEHTYSKVRQRQH